MFRPIHWKNITLVGGIPTPELSSQMSVQSGWISANTTRCPRLPKTDWAEIIWPNLCYEFPLWLICQREIQPLGFRNDALLLHGQAPSLPPSWWRTHKQWAVYYLIKLQLIIHKKSFERNANSMHFACLQMSPIDGWQMQNSLTLFFWMQHWLWLWAELAVKLG